MAQPTRAEALATLSEGHARVAALAGELSDGELSRPATIGGGQWSAKDLLGHIAFWEEVAMETLTAWRRGERPRIEQTFTTGGIDALNAWNEKRKAQWTPEQIQAQAQDVHERLVAEIEAMSDEEWRAKASYATERRRRLVTELGSVLGAPKRPFGHAFAHLPDLEAYVRGIGRAVP